MGEQRAYVRVYWAVIDDPKFQDVYDDDRHLACWLRMLIRADMAWPASADVPASARRSSVEKLVSVGLVDRVPGGRYRIHGLDAERNARSDAGRNAAAMRWHSGRIPTPDADTMPSRAEPSRAEESRAEVARDGDGRADLEAWLMVRFNAPTERQRAFLDRYCQTFDVTGPERAAQIILRNPGDPVKALKDDLDAHRKARAATLEDESRAAMERKVEERRRPTVLKRVDEPEISDEEARRIAAEYRAKYGRKEAG